jgi:outer membrane protein TolC
MAKRRPDLLALEAGYRAQDEKLRAAILAQFPAITVGFVKARDNGNISSNGLSISLSLPLFDGNRGNIAIERATRQQLHDEYSARLLADRNDMQQLLQDLQSDRALHATLAGHAAQLAEARDAAETNYTAGRLDWPTYLAIRASSLAADTALLTLEQDTHATAIALDALVGNWPDATSTHTGKSS